MTLRSMTGYARVKDTVSGIDVVVTIKSVNHRGLDLHFYTGPELDPFEAAMRMTLKRHVSRGHIDVRAQLSRSDKTGALAVNGSRLDAYVAAYNQAAARYEVSTPVDLNAAFRIPGILSEAPDLDLSDGFEAPLIALLERALTELNVFREREGSEIGTLLLERSANLERIADEIESCRRGAFSAYQSRLRDRLSDLLAGSAIEPQRIVQEAALLSDKSDIAEEIERLRIHAGQIRDLLKTGDEVGKKLDFLLQEMNRETNTILSKTNGLGGHGLRITELAVGARSDIEKIREQSLNLE
ncbi:MAG: YicC family protein [Bryobacteraceae bacterium]|nr:YicC family protein [Bryobacteraceae bacterium]